MNKSITRAATLRALTPDLIKNRQAEFIISSEAVDTYRTVFKMDGWELDKYTRNPVVVYNHRANSENPDMVIGVSELFKQDGKLIGRVTFEAAEINPVAEKIRNKVNAGTLKMASIGANPKEARMGDKSKGEDPDVLYFTRTELVEWSIVPFGSNPDAYKRNEACLTEIRKELTVIPAKEENPSGDDESSSKSEQRSVFEAQLIINKNKVK